jgi:chemotaxis protein histidine kinase CheA
MNDFIENLWSQFAIETQEHIEEIELHLVEAEQNGISTELIGSLFRAFHSLKGLATAMEMNSFARLAHRAEDILGVIRDGEFPMNSDVVSLLLASLDEMKMLRLSAVTSHTNVDANSLLLEHLAETLTSMESSAVHRDTPVSAETYPEAPLQSDPEMLSYFVELAREKIAFISHLLDPLCTVSERPDLLKNPENVALAAEEIEQLSYAAKTMDFLNLVGVLAHLRDALSLECPFTGDQQKAITESLWELHDQIRFIEHSSGNPDAGANCLHTILTDVMHVNVQRLFTRVLDHLDTLQFGSRDGDDLLIAQTLQADLSGLNSHLAFFMYNPTCNIILMLEDVFSRAARGELHLFGEILDMTRDEVTYVMEHYRDCSDGGICVRDETEIARNLQRIHDYIWAYESGCGVINPIETFRQFMGELNIEPELLKILSPENVRDLMQALEKGEQIYEVTAHLESNEKMTARFLTWIETSGSRIITNRSLFIDDMSWYEMLMVSPLSRSEISQSLSTIDPGGTYLNLKPWSGGIPKREKLLKAIEEPPERRQRIVEPIAVSSNVLRVQGETLDGFMNLIGEMVLARSRLSHIIQHERLSREIVRLKQLRTGNNSDTDGLLELLVEHRRDLVEADQLLNDSLRRLQASAVGLRVVPVEMVFKRLPRVVRDLSQSQGKRVRLEMSGQEVKIDKAMVEILTDPLLHMIRNSIDHGVEMPDIRTLAGKSRRLSYA